MNNSAGFAMMNLYNLLWEKFDCKDFDKVTRMMQGRRDDAIRLTAMQELQRELREYTENHDALSADMKYANALISEKVERLNQCRRVMGIELSGFMDRVFETDDQDHE